MPRSIAFAWTTPAFCNRQKFVTRRGWQPSYADSFKAGDELIAYDHSPRTKSELITPKQIGLIKLAVKPYPAHTRIHNSDVEYNAEGFGFFDEYPKLMPPAWKEKFAIYGVANFREYWRIHFDCGEHIEAQDYRDFGKEPSKFTYVVRFSIVEIFKEAHEYLLENLLENSTH